MYHPNWFNSRKRESGERFKITAVLPHDASARHAEILKDTRLECCKRFGGFSEQVTAGGWLNNGKLEIENSITFNVSFIDRVDIDNARELFTLAGLLLGNDWIHIELDTFEAQHTKAQS